MFALGEQFWTGSRRRSSLRKGTVGATAVTKPIPIIRSEKIEDNKESEDSLASLHGRKKMDSYRNLMRRSRRASRRGSVDEEHLAQEEEEIMKRLSTASRYNVISDAFVEGDEQQRPGSGTPTTKSRINEKSYAEFLETKSEIEHFFDSDDDEFKPKMSSREFEMSEEEKIFQTTPNGKGYPIHIENEYHKLIFDFVESHLFHGFIMGVILINTLMLILSTNPSIYVRTAWYFSAIDNIFLGIYIMEIVLKLYAWKKQFWKNPWNVLDFLIAVTGTLDFLLPLTVQNVQAFSGAAIFRILRIFKAVRAIRALRVLRTIR